VREFFPSVLDRADSDASADRYRKHWERYGFGRYTIEVTGVASFAGVVGLMHTPFDAHFTPAVEIGWRIPFANWGRGYATEAARAICAFGFDTLNLPEIVAFTTATNVRSLHVMTRLGMTSNASDDFETPLLPPGHPLRPHVLYRLPRASADKLTASNTVFDR
jgi:RimJ/RimL family protein N-acetyltransferase